MGSCAGASRVESGDSGQTIMLVILTSLCALDSDLLMGSADAYEFSQLNFAKFFGNLRNFDRITFVQYTMESELNFEP